MVNGRGAHRQRLILWIVAPAALAASCGGGPHYEEIQQLVVADHQLAIDVASREERDGPEFVRIRYVTAGEEDPALYLGEIANGGEDLSVDNIRPDSSDAPNLRLCLNGSGQGDLYVRINVNSKTVTEIPRQCSE